MASKFEMPYVRRKFKGKYITFDVTKSGRSLTSNQPLNTLPAIMANFRENGIKTVLDFGAGRLRNTWPLLLDKNFDVYICEFEELIPEKATILIRAKTMGLKTLYYPKKLKEAQGKFDAILLSYVLNTLPDKKCRKEVLNACYDSACKGAFLIVSTPNYNTNVRRSCSDSDRYDIGWVRYAAKKYKHKAFYSEPSKQYLKDLVSSSGFKWERDWNQTTAKVLSFRKI